MTKRLSEGFLGAALRQVDLPIVVWKPPDDARNWKPCDYMVWVAGSDHYYDASTPATPLWFEAKDVTAVDIFNWRDVRPSQLTGIREARRVGIRYYLAIYWRRHQHWTVSDAVRLLAWADELERENGDPVPVRFRRQDLTSTLGIDSTPGQLASVLKSILLGDV